MKPVTVILNGPNGTAFLSAFREFLSTNPQIEAHAEIVSSSPVPIRHGGPGTELAAILSSIGIQSSTGCTCKKYMAAMDGWSVDGCKLKREVIVGRIRKKAEEWGWAKGLAGAALHPVAALRLAAHVSWTDPIPGIVDLAIQRAADKAAAPQAASE